MISLDGMLQEHTDRKLTILLQKKIQKIYNAAEFTKYAPDDHIRFPFGNVVSKSNAKGHNNGFVVSKGVVCTWCESSLTIHVDDIANKIRAVKLFSSDSYIKCVKMHDTFIVCISDSLIAKYYTVDALLHFDAYWISTPQPSFLKQNMFSNSYLSPNIPCDMSHIANFHILDYNVLLLCDYLYVYRYFNKGISTVEFKNNIGIVKTILLVHNTSCAECKLLRIRNDDYIILVVCWGYYFTISIMKYTHPYLITISSYKFNTADRTALDTKILMKLFYNSANYISDDDGNIIIYNGRARLTLKK